MQKYQKYSGWHPFPPKFGSRREECQTFDSTRVESWWWNHSKDGKSSKNQSRWPEPYFPAPCLRCMCPWWIVSMMSVNLLKICLCENLYIFCKTSVAYFFTDIMSAQASSVFITALWSWFVFWVREVSRLLQASPLERGSVTFCPEGRSSTNIFRNWTQNIYLENKGRFQQIDICKFGA